MPAVTYKLEERRQKLHIRTYAVLCVILLAAMGFYSYTKWLDYEMATRSVSQNKQFIDSLRTEVGNEKATLDTNKPKYNQLSKEIEQKLKVIFPSTDDYTALTRQIDAYEEELSKVTSPFEISNIDYQTAIEEENYSVLPFRMNIRSSAENFTKFLHLVENSGTLKNKIRLMDISSIRLNFEESEAGGEESKTVPGIINFSVQINAYFQK